MLSNSSKIVLSFLWTVFIWAQCPVKAYVDVCDEPHSSVYCSCDTTSRETTVTCFIFSEIDEDDAVWRSMSDVDNVIAVSLLSRLPIQLPYIPTESLQEMKHLKTLTISEGKLGVLKSYAVSDLQSLEKLQLGGNEITGLETHAISKLPKLKRLALTDNLLQEILENSMTELLELEQLFLDRNNISRIESCAFCELQNLKELELWGNRITDLTEYTFRGLRYLRRLDLYKNQIRILNDQIFKSMPKLLEIDLKDNLIIHIAPRAFSGLDKLQRLMLNDNKLKTLPDQVFMSLPNLRFVDLCNNQLEILHAEVIERMENAKEKHFSLAIKENPFLCDCRFKWVEKYLKLNKSYQLTRELDEVECILTSKENVTIKNYLKTANCTYAHTAKPRAFVSTSYTVTESSPIELKTNHKNSVKTKSRSEVEDSYFSDNDEDEEDDDVEDVQFYDGGCGLQTINIYLTFTLILLTVLIARRETGT